MNDPFAERVERLKQELELALKWDRPSILLAVYGSEFVRTDAEGLLEAWLREGEPEVGPLRRFLNKIRHIFTRGTESPVRPPRQGLSLARIRITGPNDAVADIPQTLHEWPNREETVFFVSGLAQGAPTTWKALNVRREYLVEDKVRAVFWLSESEAADLPRRAPDFWAFRHWVVEFLEAPQVKHAVERTGELAWRGFRERLSPEERRGRIDLRERLLSELPETKETAAARAELHYTLGGLYHWDRRYEEALAHLRVAYNLAERLENTKLQAWSLNGLGNVYYQQGQHEEAIAAFQRAIDLDPEFAYPHYGLGNVYYQQGQHEEAIAAFQRAIELDPEYTSPHNNLGLVYRAQGRHEEAIAAYERAIELDPNRAIFQASFAAACHELGREADYEKHIARARELMANENEYNKACIESIAGNIDAALEHLAKALERAPGYRDWARRDPDLAFIRDDPRFQALMETTSDERNTR